MGVAEYSHPSYEVEGYHTDHQGSYCHWSLRTIDCHIPLPLVCILKQDGKLLCLVHNLQPLNAVIIWDSSTPLFVKHLAESFSGYTVYGMMDLFTGYNQ